jgi:hypothetical protein
LPKGVNIFKEQPGSKIKVDFLPYRVTEPKHPDRDDEDGIATVNELWYKRPYKLHRTVGVEKKSTICPKSIGNRCPICEYRAKLLQDGAAWDDPSVKATNTSDRNLYVVVPKETKDYEEKPHIWDISQFNFQDMLNDELDEDEEFGVFPEIEGGLTVKIRFSTEKIGKTEFAKASRIDFEEREEQYDESILKKIPNLDEVLKIHPYKKLEALFFEMEESSGEDEERDEEENEEKDERTPWEAASDRDGEGDDSNEEKTCIACEGTGKTSKGNECPICKGEGEIEPKEEENKEEQKSKSTKRKSKSTKKKKSKENECPHGHEFGTDCEEYDECDECDKFEECLDKNEEMDD